MCTYTLNMFILLFYNLMVTSIGEIIMNQKVAFSKAFIILLSIFVALMICVGTFIYLNTAQTMKTQLGKKCVGVATAVSVLIEEDIDGYMEFVNTLDTDSDYYLEIIPKLQRIRNDNSNDITFLYTQQSVSPNEIMYILDAEKPDSPLFSPPGTTDIMMQSEKEAYSLQTPYFAKEFGKNIYGTLLTCYSPIRNSSTGEFLGLVGVDVSIDQYNQVMRNQLITVIISISLLIVLLFIALLLFSGQVEKLIAIDNLTGAYNKAHFIRSLRQQIKLTHSKDNDLCVMMADLDYFKRINDTYGHIFGDVVLKQVAGIISKQLRKGDCFSRYGGEEFTAYMSGIDIDEAYSIAERIRIAVENADILNDETGETVRMTISIGIAKYEIQHSQQEVLNLADKALYEAKVTRNATVLYKEEENNHDIQKN